MSSLSLTRPVALRILKCMTIPKNNEPPYGWRLVTAADNQVELYEYVFSVEGFKEVGGLAKQLADDVVHFDRTMDTQLTITGWNIQVRMSVTEGMWNGDKSKFAQKVASYVTPQKSPTLPLT